MFNNFSQNLNELRQEKNLSQAQLAKFLGYTQSNISEWEKGSVEPKATALLAIAKFFEVTTDYLLGLEDDFGARVPTAPTAPMGDVYSPKERKIIENYRKLNASGKELIDTAFNTLLTTPGESENNKNKF